MSDRAQTTLSRLLSKILRHKAVEEGLLIRPDGYIQVSALLAHPKFKSLHATMDNIKSVVDNDDKTRFTLISGDDGWLIRANQGHSIPLSDLALVRITDPLAYPTVLHGTFMKPWRIIREEGLRVMSRNHIHLATAKYGETKSGVRRNCSVFIYIALQKAMDDGIIFELSSNGVILTSGVDGVLHPKYFSKVLDKDDRVLPFKGSDEPMTQLSTLSLHSTVLESCKLWGGAIESVRPRAWLDASLVRQVPDSQEVFLDPDRSDTSMIFELVEGSSNADCGSEHFANLGEDNEAVSCIIHENTVVSDDALKILVTGVQSVAKFNTAEVDEITVVLGIVRMPHVDTDLLVTYNAPVSLSSAASGKEIVTAAITKLKVVDWSLFPEGDS